MIFYSKIGSQEQFKSSIGDSKSLICDSKRGEQKSILYI